MQAMRLWTKLKHYLTADKGKCRNCGEPLGDEPRVRGHVHDGCAQEYDDRMAW